MNKTNLQKMQELRDSDSVVDWESIAFRAFALLTDKQIGKIARVEEYFADEKNSDTLVIGMNLSTTSEEFITYLQTLPPETVVRVAENIEDGYASYVTFNDLKLPTEFRPTNSDNLEFFADERTPELELGSR